MTSRQLRSKAAERQRDCRRRHREGSTVYRVELKSRPVETLINIGWISEAESQDKARVAAVLAELIQRWDAEWHRK